ncbi:hypothetical protein ACLOJK_009706 [Asimina triloba]
MRIACILIIRVTGEHDFGIAFSYAICYGWNFPKHTAWGYRLDWSVICLLAWTMQWTRYDGDRSCLIMSWWIWSPLLEPCAVTGCGLLLADCADFSPKLLLDPCTCGSRWLPSNAYSFSVGYRRLRLKAMAAVDGCLRWVLNGRAYIVLRRIGMGSTCCPVARGCVADCPCLISRI